MTKPAFLAQSRIVDVAEAEERHLLVKLSDIPARATVLYISHRWAGPGQADSDDEHLFMQVQCGVCFVCWFLRGCVTLLYVALNENRASRLSCVVEAF